MREILVGMTLEQLAELAILAEERIDELETALLRVEECERRGWKWSKNVRKLVRKALSYPESKEASDDHS